MRMDALDRIERGYHLVYCVVFDGQVTVGLKLTDVVPRQMG